MKALQSSEDGLAPRTLRYLVTALTLTGLGVALCTSADARSPFWHPHPPPPPYTVSVETENGDVLPTFVKDGRAFLLGEPGLRYNIRVSNPTAQRVEAVVSVDGRDAVSGEPGDYVNARGYVIPPFGSVVVDGFRRNFEQVAAFRFTAPGDSYSARRGTPQNVGVIGVAFFPERVHPAAPVIRRPIPRPAPLPYEYYGKRSTGGNVDRERSAAEPVKPRAAMPTPGAAPPPASRRGSADKGAWDDSDTSGGVNHLGTQFAETHESVVSSVSFERASATHPALLSTLRYDDAEGLSARGIDVPSYMYSRQVDDEPQAFPVSHFAEPPPR
ncbi:MAG: hypothetical protein ABI488_01595 [Polyangiaceae bacterium]